MRVRITNFQSLKSAELAVEGLTVLVGRSNIGKSAVLRALQAVLFNRAGDDFVRWGEKRAEVTIEGLPGVGTVTWEKGSGTNRYTINGEQYAKVGTGVPPALPEAGYRDVEVGGDTLRALAQSQFEPIFLLNRPGSLMAEVLTALSRLRVVQTADRLCGTELTSTKKLLKVRETDLASAREALAVWDPLPALAGRVAALKLQAEGIERRRRAVERARVLVAQRAQCLMVAGLSLPEAPPLTPAALRDLTVRVDRHGVAVELPPLRRRYLPLAQAAVPPVTVVPPAVPTGVGTVTAARPARLARPRLVALAALSLPAGVDVTRETVGRVTMRNTLRPLLAQRRPLAALALHVPAARAVPLPILYERVAAIRAGRQSTLSRQTAIRQGFDAQTALNALTMECEMAEADLAQFKATHPTCPTCGQSW